MHGKRANDFDEVIVGRRIDIGPQIHLSPHLYFRKNPRPYCTYTVP